MCNPGSDIETSGPINVTSVPAGNSESAKSYTENELRLKKSSRAILRMEAYAG